MSSITNRVLLILIYLSVVSFASIGIDYNSTTKVYDLQNDYHHFYINSTSGWQMSNVPGEFWSQNTICVKASVVTGSLTNYPVQCFDKLSWTWANVTNNKTFANLTGTATCGLMDI